MLLCVGTAVLSSFLRINDISANPVAAIFKLFLHYSTMLLELQTSTNQPANYVTNSVEHSS
jgi:hypothetical protein